MSKQQTWLAPRQVKCLECGTTFVPVSKYTIRQLDKEDTVERDWLTSHEWAIDRVYQENLLFCTVECLEKSYLRQLSFEIERIQHKHSGKYR